MNDFVFVDEGISCYELFHEVACFWLIKFFLNSFAEVWVAELGDDVSIVLGRVDLVEGEDVGELLHFLEDFDFGGEEGTVDFWLEHFEVDDLDSDGGV